MRLHLNNNDLNLLKNKNIKIEEFIRQIGLFQKGVPHINIVDIASVNNGTIKKLSDSDIKHYINIFEQKAKNKKIVKFTPASGAATRMFKKLFQFLNNEIPLDDQLKNFFLNLHKLAFYDDIIAACNKIYKSDLNSLIQNSQFAKITNCILSPQGLNYGQLPKALIKFHKYPDHPRTATEEHLVEALNYAIGKNNQLILHFTISPQHQDHFQKLANSLTSLYNNKANILFQFSVQKTSTDTVAVDFNNQPFRKEDGSLLFRPGGHGSLIYNLNDIDADLIFIKNIDNVAPDRLKKDTFTYFKALAGYLLTIKNTIDGYIELLELNPTDQDLDNILNFIQSTLCIKPTKKLQSKKQIIDFAKKILLRPLRVAGMVKNIGQPGGGPYLVQYDDFISPQIVESAQIDTSIPKYKELLEKSTHFNPTFMVISTKDPKNNKYNLLDFVDHNASIITTKSYKGKDIKVLERPGLWNGAMAFWNTVFVEVPLTVFNPVKTVFDLLKPNHQ